MSPRRTFAGFLIGLLTIQAAWILAMPAFRGSDEFDHVFRADGVSHGSILPDKVQRPGVRGTLTPVRLSVIEAASRVCASYHYTEYYDCHPYDRSTATWNRAGSGAGRYNPLYYLYVGNVGRFFHGVAVDYAMRAVSALACALLIAWAAVLWTGPGRSRWRTLGLLTALTPVLIYSTAIAAPNGMSYAAGLLYWVAGLSLIRGPMSPARSALVAAAVSSVVLCNTHTTGPLWLVCITLAFAILEPRRCLALLRQRPVRATGGVVGLGMVASVIWTALSGANFAGKFDKLNGSPRFGDFLVHHVIWLLQTIAAFPLRDESAPPIVYALWLLPFIAVCALAVRIRGRALLAVGWVTVAILGASTALTLAAFKSVGYAWQGRYGLPLVVGLVLVPAAYARGREVIAPVFDTSIMAAIIASGVSVWHVANHERHFVQQPTTAHLAGGAVIAGVLAASGFALLCWTLRVPRQAGQSAPLPTPDPSVSS